MIARILDLLPPPSRTVMSHIIKVLFVPDLLASEYNLEQSPWNLPRTGVYQDWYARTGMPGPVIIRRVALSLDRGSPQAPLASDSLAT